MKLIKQLLLWMMYMEKVLRRNVLRRIRMRVEIDRQGLLIEDSLPNDIYTEIAKKLAFCRYNQDFLH